MSAHMEQLRLPSDFNRRLRNLHYVDLWKASEFKMFVNSNVHNLLHVYEELYRYGDLSTISAYPFESKLHEIKQLVRSGRHSLVQAVNRLTELQRVKAARISKTETTDSRVTGFTLRDNFRDQCFMTFGGCIFLYKGAQQVGDTTTTQGCQFSQQAPFFLHPYPSQNLNIYSANMRDLNHAIVNVFCDNVMCKLAAVETITED
uniref:Uncharacterized protein n=1 Tax=Anopheles epiroticus TaxID=199890 RepID=A0A182PWQ1_9DIPT